jgi:hypothetical protein
MGTVQQSTPVNQRLKLPRSHRQKRYESDSPEFLAALRTAFIARFIVLREGRRTKAHRALEHLRWDESTTIEALYDLVRTAFVKNGDKMAPVDRDLRRALEHARCSAEYFAEQYIHRKILSFEQALIDYHKSNLLLFGDENSFKPRSGGWRIPQ